MTGTIGFIGVGVLADYMVKGIKRVNPDQKIVVSPRGKEAAEKLAQSHGVEIAADNQVVVDAADIVFLSTKPKHASEAIEGLNFTEDQVLLSVVAGFSESKLKDIVAPATVVRSLPLIGCEVGAGATPIYPHNDRVEALLGSVSTVVPFEDEAQFELAAVSGVLNGWVYDFASQLQAWLEDKGFEPEKARTLAIETFHGATSYAKHFEDLSLAEQGAHIGQPGTFTKTAIDAFDDAGGNKALHAACEAIHKRLVGDE